MTNFLSWLLEDRANGGLGGPPNNHRMSPHFPSRQHGMSNGVEYHGIMFDNDAFDVWVYRKYDETEESKYVLTLAAEDFRKLALWYLWRWVWGEWFGLRRKLFYVYLHRKVAKWSK